MKKLPEPTVLPCDRQGSILRKTLILLRVDTRSLQTISFAYGIPLAWLTKLRNDRIESASVNRVQYLYEKLSGEKL